MQQASPRLARSARAIAGAALLAAVLAPVAGATISFQDVTTQAGFNYQHGYVGGLTDMPRTISGGVAAGDYDRDGFVDLYVVRGDIGPNLLFRNLGNGSFTEVGATAGVDLPGMRAVGPTFVDYDGDGWLDLFVGGIEGSALQLLRNRGDGTFENVTAASGLTSLVDTWSAAFGDYDGDNDLDVFLAHWSQSGTDDHLWRNDGNGSFTAADALANITGLTDTGYDFSFTPNFADINNDGCPDLVIACDFGTSQVFHNQCDGTFQNVDAGPITDENGMGAAVCDYDHDGDLDWFVSSIWEADGVPDGGWGVSGNRLYRNTGNGTFEDATTAAGVRAGHWGWGSSFADFDNNGHPDIFHVNGWTHPTFDNDPAVLFMSNGNGTFTEQAAALGIADTGQGRGIVCFDLERDGDLDVFIANNSQAPKLYRNDGGNQNHFLTVKLRGSPPNSEAIGARVYLTANGTTQMREIRCGSNFESQDPAEAHFGLGNAPWIDQLWVVWPDGRTSNLGSVSADQLLVLDENVLVPALNVPVAVGLALVLAMVGARALRHRAPLGEGRSGTRRALRDGSVRSQR